MNQNKEVIDFAYTRIIFDTNKPNLPLKFILERIHHTVLAFDKKQAMINGLKMLQIKVNELSKNHGIQCTHSDSCFVLADEDIGIFEIWTNFDVNYTNITNKSKHKD